MNRGFERGAPRSNLQRATERSILRVLARVRVVSPDGWNTGDARESIQSNGVGLQFPADSGRSLFE